MVMHSLFTNSVYVSISSFDTATMQGIFSFLDTQVALYHYLISRVRAGNCAPDNNLLERATTTALKDAMSSYMDGRASGLELILVVLPLGLRAMHSILTALRTTKGWPSTVTAATTTTSA